MPNTNLRVAGAAADGLLHKRDHLVNRPGEELAPAQPIQCDNQVGVRRERSLVLGNGLLPAVLRAQHLVFNVVGQRIARRYRQGAVYQGTRACEFGRDQGACSIEHAQACERACQVRLRLDGFRIERQRALE